jgi:hypothetical protein
MRKAHHAIGHGLHALGAEQAPLGRRGDELREPAPVDEAFFLPAVPAVARGVGQQRAQFTGQARDVHALRGDAAVEFFAVVGEHFLACERDRVVLAVVGGGEDAVGAARLVHHRAAARLGGGEALDDLAIHVGDEAEHAALVVHVRVARIGAFFAGLVQHRGDGAGDGERMHGVGGLVRAIAAQAREGVADERSEVEARGFEHVLGFLHHLLAAHAGAADLRDGIEQQAARGVGQARMVEGERPLLVTVPQVVTHAGHDLGRERFDAELLEHFEQHAFDRLFGAKAFMQCRIGRGEPQCESIGHAAERGEIVGVGRGMQVRREPRQRHAPPVQTLAAKMQVALAAEGAHRARAELGDLLLLPHAALHRARGRVGHSPEPDDSWCDSFSSWSKQRWKYSATSGRSASSHLLTNERRNASAGSLKISTFSAQVMTVRGDISVERSPAAKPLRVRSATATIDATSLRPASSASEGTRACTIAISSSAGR